MFLPSLPQALPNVHCQLLLFLIHHHHHLHHQYNYHDHHHHHHPRHHHSFVSDCVLCSCCIEIKLVDCDNPIFPITINSPLHHHIIILTIIIIQIIILTIIIIQMISITIMISPISPNSYQLLIMHKWTLNMIEWTNPINISFWTKQYGQEEIKENISGATCHSDLSLATNKVQFSMHRFSFISNCTGWHNLKKGFNQIKS